MEDVNKQRRNFISLSELGYGPLNSASGGFAYIWQSKKGGIIAIKTEKTQIHFLSDVLITVASLDLKVHIRRFYVVVVQWTSKKCTKKRDARAELLF